MKKNKVYYHSSPFRFKKFEPNWYYMENEIDWLKFKEKALENESQDQFIRRQRRLILKELKNYEVIFFSPRKTFMNNHGFYVYTCINARPLNLFNIACDSDIKKIEKLSPEMKEYLDRFHKTKDRSYQCMESPSLIVSIKKVGFDGFCVEENSENIAIFNPEECIKIIKREKMPGKNKYGKPENPLSIENIKHYINSTEEELLKEFWESKK
jgi:hypothetical protein